MPSQSIAQPITFPHPAVQVPWATGKIVFGHVGSKVGPPDVLASAPGQSYFPYAQVWLNDGHGNFTAGAQLSAGGLNAESFTLADLNGDGWDDAIVVSRSNIIIYINNGDGTFTQSAYYATDPNYFPILGNIQPIKVVAGRTSTGKWNIAVIGAAQSNWGFLYSVNGDGTLAPNPQVLLTSNPYPGADLAFVDVNRNGFPALVVPGLFGGPVAVFANDGSGNFGNSANNGRFSYQTPTFSLPAPSSNYIQDGVNFIDMDHDGILDMVVMAFDLANGNSNSVSWYKGLGGGKFDTTPHLAWSGGTYPALEWQGSGWGPQGFLWAAAIDIAGDGNSDLALSCQLGQPIILKNNGDGTFTKAWAAPLTDSNGNRSFAEHMSFVDVTGTGQKSLIGANYTNNSFQIATPYGEFYGSPQSNLPPPVVTSASVSAGYGSAFSYAIQATNTPTSYGAAPLLPGLVFSTSTGVISGTLPNALGTSVVGLSATNAGGTGTGSLTLTILDPTPPKIASVTPSPGSIWPPNKKMVPVTLSAGGTNLGNNVVFKITSVTTNEPDGSTQWQITGPMRLNLLADRLGTGTGRIYTITVVATDAAGSTSTATCIVTVPHDQGK